MIPIALVLREVGQVAVGRQDILYPTMVIAFKNQEAIKN
jgi:hypothetical protein